MSHGILTTNTLVGLITSLCLALPSSVHAEELSAGSAAAAPNHTLRKELKKVLRDAGFTGKIERTLRSRLGRRVDEGLADLGRVLWFDTETGLHGDNACGGCHSPSSGMADTQSIAIGIQSNQVIGPDRTGPRNQRRSPSVVNSAFYPALMWNGRFFAPSDDPFDNSAGFSFPAPEGDDFFDGEEFTHLLIAQAFIPPTELVEVAGFSGTAGTISPRFDQFDDGLGTALPPADAHGFRNDAIRALTLEKLNAIPEYVERFGDEFREVRRGAPIDFTMFAKAITEFEFSLVFANAPIDKFARGATNEMTESEVRGALLFFGKAGCVECHAVSGTSNEMFSDFESHNIGVPQISPFFGVGLGNVIFDGEEEAEDFGLAQVTGLESDRYKFRTTPLRNVSLQPTFFHNGSFTDLSSAIAHHLDAVLSACEYDPENEGLDEDLTYRMVPPARILETLDPKLDGQTVLTSAELSDLVEFVRNGLLDERAAPEQLCELLPEELPSGRPPMTFQGCP